MSLSAATFSFRESDIKSLPQIMWFNGWQIVRDPTTDDVTITSMTTGKRITEPEREALLAQIDASLGKR